MSFYFDSDTHTTTSAFSMKLKVYGGLHDTVNQHNSLLKERSHVLIAARKKLVEESGSVLGK